MITLGAMTMYIVLFNQAQSAVTVESLGDIGGMYEDNLYLSNLYEFLEHAGRAAPARRSSGPGPGRRRALRARLVHAIPGSHEPALAGVNLHIPPGRSSRSSARTARARPR